MTTTNKNDSISPESGRATSALVKLRSLLSVRDHSDFEIRKKLSASFPLEEIEDALAYAHAQKWVQTPEEQSARLIAQLTAKNKGRAFIEQALEERGLPLLSATPDISGTSDELEKARKLLESKLAPATSLDYEERARLTKKFYRLLAGRGFDEDVIRVALSAAGFSLDEFSE